MKYCSNCGVQLKEETKFCFHCGKKVASSDVVVQASEVESTSNEEYTKKDQSGLNGMIPNPIPNQQNSISNTMWIVAFIALVVLIMTMTEASPIYEVYALTMLSIFVMISAVVVSFMFRSRGHKLDKLLTGEALLAAWEMDNALITAYANHLFEREREKNKAVFYVIGFLVVLIFGGFILFMDEGKMFMFLMGVFIMAFISIFAFGMPYYYRNKNKSGDGQVFIGSKYAYINGYFHNWDFPLSGLEKVKIIKEPFRGLSFTYYYTDRTLTNTEELVIPAPTAVDLEVLKQDLISGNKKRRRKRKK